MDSTIPSVFAVRQSIRELLLSRSRYIQSPNFLRCHESDLRLLFDAYDAAFFLGDLSAGLKREHAHPLPLRFAGRLRSSGGRTIRTRDRRSGRVAYAIEISHNVLFENFRTPEETAVVCGVPCADRLDALMRVMEHELLHLHEFLTTGRSNCGKPPFQRTAASMFGHASHQHAMLTRRQKAIQSTGLRPGHRVTFTHDGRTLRGVVNRINTRATVLVEDGRGVKYTDGKRYVKFYVPLSAIRAVSSA